MCSTENAAFFADALMDWYYAHKRDLPWRHTRDPYRIWLSEILLQQTRVAQGMPYYHAFLEAFPTVQAMAKADEERVLRLWQGLGYYNRARNLHKTAQLVAEAGAWPKTYEGLLELKGVGPYTAAAIASFAYDEDVAVVDGNVYRVLARYFGLEEDIAKPKGQKHFRTLAEQVLPQGKSATYNQAIMEFGALHCVPKKPKCLLCPLQNTCSAYAQGKTELLPIKSKAKKKKKVYMYYLILRQNGMTRMRKRPSTGVWANMYDFPLLESAHKLTKNDLDERLRKLLGDGIAWSWSKEKRHELSHRALRCRFLYVSEFEENSMEETAGEWQADEELESLPKPVLVANFLKDEKNTYF